MIAAVTGTKGKTTVVRIVSHCLEKAGLDYSSICTIGLYKNGKRISKRGELRWYHRFFDMDSDFTCFEATSHLLGRRTQLEIPRNSADVVVLTGIERGEHEEQHELFSGYLDAKKNIFDVKKSAGTAFVCRDTKEFESLVDGVEGFSTYGFDPSSDYVIELLNQEDNLSEIMISGRDLNVRLDSRLIGSFNHQNITAAYLILREMGLNRDQIISGIKSFSGAPGRFERFTLENDHRSMTVIIDYAHTPASFRATLELAKEIYPESSLCTVFGCGGDRTAMKRPLMGREASEQSDVVIITDDNPRFESPEKIIDNIMIGVVKPCQVIRDREEAIAAAVDSGCDIILLAGKGSEETYNAGNKIYSNRSDRTLLTKVCNDKKIKISPFFDDI